MPRTRPSVGCSAMVRTRPSPMCCCDFADDVDRVGHVEAFAGDADGRVDHGNLPFGKLEVDGRAGHLDHFADYDSGSCCHMISLTPAAAAPLTISIISLVMLACRTRFMYSVSFSIMSRRVGGGRIHGRHARGMFGGGRFEQRAVELASPRSAAAALPAVPPAAARRCNRSRAACSRHFDRQHAR